MKLPRPYTIQSQFLLGMTAAAICIGALFAAGFYYQMHSVLENEVHEKAELILTQVEAVQGYVRKTLRPRMYEEMPDKFVIEAMSTSFISRAIMERAGLRAGHLIYRRVSVDARNPEFEANETERGIIEMFRAKPWLTVWQGHAEIDGKDHFVMARPVRFEASCLYCHGEPSQAPREILERYGARGFGRELDVVGGLDFVGLPVSSQMVKVQNKVMTYLVIFSLTAVLFFLATHVVFKRVVSDNVRTLTRVLRSNVRDAEGQELLRHVQSRDEVGEMVLGVEQLGRHIAESRQKLEEYAATLEDKVAERTRELARESAERTADVDLFVRLLRVFNRSQTRPQLWRRSLPLIVDRFGLERAAYVCTFASQNYFVWPVAAEKPRLPDDHVQLLIHSETRIDGGTAFIPVESAEGNTEGLLCLYRRPGESFRPEDREILRALGRQLGIAAEYLGALDNILRHSEKLQAIFEGISDPLLLVDAHGAPIVTNQAARELAADLSGGTRDDGNVIPLLCAGQGGDGACDIALTATRGVFEAREVRLDSGRSFALGLHPVPAAAGEGRLVVHVREVTARRRMMEQVTQSEKLATVGKLAAGLAHEINNPLGVILCYADLLRKTAREDQLDDLGIIARHTRQARTVLRNLLNFARPKVATDRDTDLAAAAGAVARVFGPQAEKRGAAIRLTEEDGVPAVRVEPQAVEHIMANLLLNALDAVPPEGGEIVVATRYDHEAGEVVLSVSDNGGGIAPEHLPHLFDPFFTTKQAGKGTGLGLTVIYGFMRDLGGRIEVSNRFEGGARFELRFPAARTGGPVQDAGSEEER